jgi:hypothetical protein
MRHLKNKILNSFGDIVLNSDNIEKDITLFFEQEMTSSFVKNLCQEILENEFAIDDLLQRSVFHANNFYKIPIYIDNPHGWRLRLHYWKSGLVIDDYCIHDHSSTMLCKVLYGQLFNYLYTLEHDDDKYYVSEYSYDHTNQSAQKTMNLNKIGVKLISENLYTENNIYEITPDQFHIGLPNLSDAITIVLQYPDQKYSSTIIYSENYKNNQLRKIEKIEFVDLLKKICNLF